MEHDDREPKRILVVDDDQAIRQLLCTLIRREQLAVDCVADGSEAIEKLAQTRYSVILLDLMMPKLDGFGVIRYLAERRLRPKPIVFVISAYADQSFKRVDPAVVAGVIHKPFDVVELGAIVRQCALSYDEEVAKSSLRRAYDELEMRSVELFDDGNEQSEISS